MPQHGAEGRKYPRHNGCGAEGSPQPMRHKVLLRTYALVCAIILIGFSATVVTLYHAYFQTYTQHAEEVSSLASEGIYYQFDSMLARPITVAQSMANDTLLRSFMEQETARRDDPVFAQTLRDYLQGYHARYGYSSVFFVSSVTHRYYYYGSAAKSLDPKDPKNAWYYDFLSSGAVWKIQIADDPASANAKTVFVTSRLNSADDKALGVIGVGLRMDTMQTLLASYEKRFAVRAFLVSHDGNIQLSTDHGTSDNVQLSEVCGTAESVERLLHSQVNGEFFWDETDQGHVYIGSRYIPGLAWYLVVENDTTPVIHGLRQRMYAGIAVALAVMIGVLATITAALRSYNKRIIALTQEAEHASRSFFERATEEMFESILDIDITHDRAANERTVAHFRKFGLNPRLPYSQMLRIIAERQLQPEFRHGYLRMFSPQSIIAAYESGINALHYDAIMTDEGEHYSWMRIIARILRWDQDGSIHLLTYRQNIDAEKRQETHLLDQLQRDTMTGLYDKMATEEHMREALSMVPLHAYAFFIIDIDNFKGVNDRFGHAAGDFAIISFSRTLANSLRESDLVGRIGGDEFAALLPLSSRDIAAQKAAKLVTALSQTVLFEGQEIPLSASIGVALSTASGGDFETLYRYADAALYHTKHSGKNSFTIYGEF